MGKNNARWKIFQTIIFIAAILLTSCSPNIRLKISPEKDLKANTYSAEIHFSAVPTKTASDAISRFAGIPEGESLFSESGMKEALKGSNFNLVQFTSGKDGSIGFAINTKDLNSTFNAYSTEGNSTVISVKQKNESGKTKNIAEITINPENINAILSHFPPETRDYIDILMAPVFTGEALTKEEYIQLIKAAYGEKLATELSQENLKIELDIPVDSIKVFLNGNEKNLSGNTMLIPLAEFLSMYKGFSLKIIW